MDTRTSAKFSTDVEVSSDPTFCQGACMHTHLYTLTAILYFHNHDLLQVFTESIPMVVLNLSAMLRNSGAITAPRTSALSVSLFVASSLITKNQIEADLSSNWRHIWYVPGGGHAHFSEKQSCITPQHEQTKP